MRRSALMRAKLSPSALEASLRRSLSSTNSRIICHAISAGVGAPVAVMWVGPRAPRVELTCGALRALEGAPGGHDEGEHQDGDAASGQGPPAAWLAAARSVWPETAIFEVTRAPTTATPSVWPICRDVEAMPAATPAWARGMPDTAALVMGAFTKPKPMRRSHRRRRATRTGSSRR